MDPLMIRAKNAWHIFRGRDPTPTHAVYSSGYNPGRVRLNRTNSKSIVTSVYNQIAVDVSSVDINHVRLTEERKFSEIIYDDLNNALTLSANLDQSGRDMIRDAVMTMLDEGCVAIVPTVTDIDPYFTDSYKIYELRVGRILEWMPKSIRVSIYNPEVGERVEVVVQKRISAIIENPFYAIMNEPNSTAKRLARVLSQLDVLNEESSSGKLDLIVQLPYTVKSKARQKMADGRRKDIEAQLTGSKYGIAYIDGTERVIQLNRAVENNLWTQAKELQENLYSELGFSKAIFDGTADEQTLLTYHNRTLEPILSAITENMERKWISKTAQTQLQGIRYFKDPFKLVPVGQIAEIADKFTRNEIMSSNEIRSVIGMKPSKDPKADMLINSNLNQSNNDMRRITEKETVEIQNQK